MSRANVLVVDDDRDIAANLADILHSFGYDTDLAYDGASAIELAHEKPYDVALLDYKMPDMDGATLYADLKRIQPAMVAILITAYAGNDGVQRALAAGTWKVLRKPVDVPQLLDLVNHAVDQPVVLLVDDDRDFCLSMWEVLRSEGFRVGLAFDQAAAQEALANREIDLVVLDLILGQEEATALMQSVRDTQAIPVIVITGHPDRATQAARLLTEGALSVESKPLDVQALVQKIRTAVTTRS